jgi:hypothetical protein
MFGKIKFIWTNCLKEMEMESVVKKVMRIIIVGLFLLASGFAGGYLFNRCGNAGDPPGAGADVSGYDNAAERIERAAGAVEAAGRNVGEAAGEIRIGVSEAGRVGELAGDIGDGTSRALVGVGGIADGIQRVMGILDGAEKRNAEMEDVVNSRLD